MYIDQASLAASRNLCVDQSSTFCRQKLSASVINAQFDFEPPSGISSPCIFPTRSEISTQTAGCAHLVTGVARLDGVDRLYQRTETSGVNVRYERVMRTLPEKPRHYAVDPICFPQDFDQTHYVTTSHKSA